MVGRTLDRHNRILIKICVTRYLSRHLLAVCTSFLEARRREPTNMVATRCYFSNLRCCNNRKSRRAVLTLVFLMSLSSSIRCRRLYGRGKPFRSNRTISRLPYRCFATSPVYLHSLKMARLYLRQSSRTVSWLAILTYC
jgi:hypothetical protein